MRRLAVALVGLGVLLAVPVAILVVRALDSADIEEASRHRAIAERAFDEMEEALSRLLDEEEARPFDAYRFYSHVDPGREGHPATTIRSPLADAPEHDFVIGYFQVDPDGSLHTPRIPRDPEPARQRGDFHPSAALDEVLQELRDEWAHRRRTPGRSTGTLAARDGKREAAEAEPHAGMGLRDLVPSLPAPTAQVARPRLTETGTAQRQSIDDVYRSLNRAPARRAERKQKVTTMPMPEIAPLLEADRLEKRARATLSALPERLEEARSGTAGAAPRAAPPAAPGTVRITLDPMVGREADDGRMLLYRTVLVGHEGYRQGLLIDWRRLGAWLQTQVIAPSALHDARVSIVAATAAVGDPLRPRDGERYVYRHRFSEPFDAFGIELGMPPLPGGRGSGTIYALAALLAGATALGLFAVYRMVAVVVHFAERRNRFVAAVSHELKTPLTTIRMYGEMLRDGLVADETKREEYYRTITGESERLSRLIDNVLDFSRLEKGEHEAAARPLDAAEVVRAAALTLRPHAERAGFVLETDIAADLPRVLFDGDALTQMVFNLVDNALKYARDAATRSIRLSCRLADDGRHVEVSVRDHGPGVPSRDLARIFEPFYRRGDELTRTTKGTGIGLALVKELAGSLGARVEAANAPGGGLHVAVQLALAPGA